MSTIKEILHEKRKITENHIKQLQQEGKQDVRYTAMMPDIPFLVFGLLNFASGLPIYLSFKKGIFYGVK